MRPEWFALPPEYVTDSRNDMSNSGLRPIPFDRMWEDDRHWFPLMLSRQFFVGRVDFSRSVDSSGDSKMVRWWFGVEGKVGQ